MRVFKEWIKRVARRLRVEYLSARARLADGMLRRLIRSPARTPLWYRFFLTVYLVKRLLQTAVTERRFPNGRAWSLLHRDVESNFLIRWIVWRDWPIREPVNLYTTFRLNNVLLDAEKEAMRQASRVWVDRPLISIVVPVYNAQPRWIQRLVQSVVEQTYDRWELILVDDHSHEDSTQQALFEAAQLDDRVSLYRLDHNQGVVHATNRGVEWSHGAWIAFLDHDDELMPDALWWVVKTANESPSAEVIYTDEEIFHDIGGFAYPHLKPAFSPQQLQAYNYICHLLVVRRESFDAVGQCRPGTEGAQDYDLVLRLAERTDQFVHIPRLLYRWHVVERSMSRFVDEKSKKLTQSDHLDETTRFVVQGHFDRIGSIAHADIENHWVMPRFEPIDHGRVTIIIGTKDQPRRLARCIESIERLTRYPNYEILILDNDQTLSSARELLSRLAKKHRVVRVSSGPQGFSFSALNNQGARLADSPFILFLNDDTEVLKPDWLSAMVGTLHFPGVEIVGARLLYPGRLNQHAGLIMGALGWGPWHALIGIPADTPAYGGYMTFPHNAIGVTGACLLTRKETFVQSGGFDETNLAVSFNDVDFCLRVFQQGGRIAYAPQAELLHDEGASRGRFARPAEVLAMKQKWQGMADPYWNPQYSRVSPHFALSPRRFLRGMGIVSVPRVAFAPAVKEESLMAPILESLAIEGAIELRSAEISIENVDALIIEGPIDLHRAHWMDQCSLAGISILWSMPGRFLLPLHAGPVQRAEFLRTIERWPEAYQVVFSDPYSIGWGAAGLPRPNLELVTRSLSPEQDRGPVDTARRQEARRYWGLEPDQVLFWAPLSADDLHSTRFLISMFSCLPEEVKRTCQLVIEWDRSPTGSTLDLIRSMMRKFPGPIAVVGPDDGSIFAADVILAHETIDPRPLRVMQGLAHSLPIIGTPLVEFGDLIHRPSTGRVALPFHRKLWKRSILELAKDPVLRERLGTESRHWLASRETWPDTLVHWKRLILEAAELTRAKQEAARLAPKTLEEFPSEKEEPAQRAS
jgi:glycosyltransferase involved in cell wall biosynthesis